MKTRITSGHRNFSRLISHAYVGHPPTGEDRGIADSSRRRWVLCDGASEGWDPAGWAGILARSLAMLGPNARAIVNAREDFASSSGSKETSGGADWLSVRARVRGSWSTALVVEASPGSQYLEISSIGDTCAFILDGFVPVLSFPLSDPLLFSSTPDLIGGEHGPIPAFNRVVVPLGRLKRPSFALATDALAARLLSEMGCTNGSSDSIWRFLAGADEKAFKAWVEEGIERGAMTRDDATLMWVWRT